MVKGNFYFNKLKRPYIFPIIEQKLSEVKLLYPDVDIINMGIGDIALPLAPSISKAITLAVEEMKEPFSLYGYGPSEGYSFLREAIKENSYKDLPVTSDEVFISDGINTDIVNILDLFHNSCSVAIPNPAYPAYLDSNILDGRHNRIYVMPCTKETGFVPENPSSHCDIIYLCSPHNPTGVAMTRDQLKKFIDYAIKENSIILFDNAYDAFVTSKDVPQSIYEIPGAEKVAIEFKSFSKSAGFTGLRCSYLILPKGIQVEIHKKKHSLHALWKKRQSIKFNGVSYPIQRGAAATFSPLGKKETKDQVQFYLSQARQLKEGLEKAGQICYGGIDSPYIWWQTPKGTSSWEFFDLLLHKCQIIAIPGCGFGKYGEGYVRLSGFSLQKKTTKALERIQQLV